MFINFIYLKLKKRREKKGGKGKRVKGRKKKKKKEDEEKGKLKLLHIIQGRKKEKCDSLFLLNRRPLDFVFPKSLC